jgi:hypothetical protein
MDDQGIGRWCQVHLRQADTSHRLGAETVTYLVEQLLSFLQNETPGQRWVLSLSEQHFSVYGQHEAREVILRFEDAEGRTFSVVKLSPAEKQRWIRELSQLTPDDA